MDPQWLSTTLEQGDTGAEVKLVQEWLNLRGLELNITSLFGAATEAAVLDFCAAQDVDPQPFVDPPLFLRLINPMLRALAPVPAGEGVSDTLVAIAEQQLAQSPCEVGGVNCGPWVRLYMKGKEGAAQAWAGGFVSYCLERACDSVGAALPFATSTSVVELVEAARGNGRHTTDGAFWVRPGDLFVTHSTSPRDAAHTGVVRAIDAQGFDTIEVDRDRVTSKRRPLGGCDFLTIPGRS